MEQRAQQVWGAASLAALLMLTSCGGGDAAQDGTAEDEATPAAEGGDGAEATTGEDAEGESQADAEQEARQDEAPDFAESSSTSMIHDTTLHQDSLTDTVISPKSVVASGDGLAIANNMLYQNTVTIYDTETKELVQELPDTVNPGELGAEGHPDSVEGAPVEAVWTEDGDYAYVSNYRLADMGATAEDSCAAGDAIAPSAVYRYNVAEQDWDQFIEVGRVPKFVELTPDGSRLLVTNWCDFDLSVIDTETGEEEFRVPLNAQPRGIAAMPDNETVYVTAMYADELYTVDLESQESEVIYDQASFPRHLVLSPDGETLYVTFSRSNLLVAFDTETDEVIRTADTGQEPRTMDISADGSALYVVNYDEDTVSKFDAESFEEISRESTGHLPIGVSYDPVTASVWVANYSGTIDVFDDSGEASGDAEDGSAE
ncbi:YncE family protein [Nesterenkonia cremea]|uniref:YncE family protein n=1 Tax=Nesterenkonia cremea TaxID=1882340 RepID=A0A917ET27_9MICC|nr:YncE family protein [Nesterenkonia cremea]GGE77021.1 hypothetical protein GCM10011401_25490 [Nesterenkonia cremea]